jgi:hypothetical protein
LGRGVEAHRLAVEQRGEEGGGLVAFDPAAHVHEQREAGRVRLRKTVFTEALNLAENGFGELAFVAAGKHPVDDPTVELLQPTLAAPCRHRAAQCIGFAGRKAGGQHRDLHHLLLEDRHAQRTRQRRLDLLARVDHRFQPLTSTKVWMHHAPLDRAGTHDRHFDHQIVEISRAQARQHAHLGA